MNSHHIDKMAEQIAKKLGIKDKEKTDTIWCVLKDYWSDKIAISWSIEDIKQRAIDIGKGKITDRKARRILDEVLLRHDASIGINWTTIDDAIIDACQHLLVRPDGLPSGSDDGKNAV